MAKKHAKKIGGEVIPIDGGFRVTGPETTNGNVNNSNLGQVDLTDFYVDRLSGAQSGRGLDGMDYANNAASFIGTIVGGAQFTVGAVKNQSLWNASHKTHKALKSVGVNVQTRVIKHGAKTALANASRNIAIVGAGLAVTDIFMDGQVKASHVLNLTMVGVSAIPVVGWIAGGAYFAADMITLGVSGQSIGQHLDAAVGGPLVNDIYD